MNQIYIRGNEIATKEYVDSLSLGGNGSALDNYYTKEEVNELIEENSSTGGDTNLTNYYTKEEINNIISETNNSTQVEEMPEPSEDNKGTIVQYIGVTNENYTTSNFYQVVEKTIINEDGSETTIYVWEEILTPEINLDDYATKEYVDNLSLGGGENVDLSNYYTKEEMDAVINLNNHVPYYSLCYTDNIKMTDVNSNALSLTSIYDQIQDIVNDVYTKGYKNFILHLYRENDNNGEYQITYDNMNVDLQTQPTLIRFGYQVIANSYVTSSFCRNTLDIGGTWTDNVFKLNYAYVRGRTDYYAASNTVLTKTNTTAFTPTADYHPATKKYVDDLLANSNGLIDVEETTIDSDTFNNMKTGDIYRIVNSNTRIYYNGTLSISTNYANALFIGSTFPLLIDGNNITCLVGGSKYTLNMTKIIDADTVLTKTNTTSFTPTNNYHPATKKYVDDAITTSIAGISTTSMNITTSLPTENISTSTIYLIKDETASTDSENVYNEYVYINGKWENIGSTKTTVDLSNYYNKQEINTMIGDINSLLDAINGEEV